jgi:hypothetical protein
MEIHGFDPVRCQLEPALNQHSSHRGTQQCRMTGKMVAMRVRDKGARLGPRRVQPQVDLRQVQAPIITNFDQAARSEPTDLPIGKQKPVSMPLRCNSRRVDVSSTYKAVLSRQR